MLRDEYGRPICRLCARPMFRAPTMERDPQGKPRVVFACLDCETAEVWKAGQKAEPVRCAP